MPSRRICVDIELLSVYDLECHQVRVHRVSVNSQVDPLPGFGSAGLDEVRSWVHEVVTVQQHLDRHLRLVAPSIFSLATTSRGARFGVGVSRGIAGSFRLSRKHGIVRIVRRHCGIDIDLHELGHNGGVAIRIRRVGVVGHHDSASQWMPVKSTMTSKRSPGAISKLDICAGVGRSPPSDPMTQKGRSLPPTW